ncbi:HAMP domain-containing histidine kinase [bacterium]|nr:HAMP domain-containing histidine kinase [candidate division CSSED10-310 bacterium]
MDTFFAPAERMECELVNQQADFLAESANLLHLLDLAPAALLVLNECRQVVYANQPARDLSSPSLVGGVIGKRPGEMLGCIYATQTPGGCGTSEFCSTCGAVKSILASQQGVREVQECNITVESGDIYELRVTSTPLTVKGIRFTAFAVSIINDEKRREVLERVFFHDILNTLTGLYGSITLLKWRNETGEQNEDDEGDYLSSIDYFTRRLIEEIKAQRDLQLAEHGDLKINPEQLESKRIIQEVVELFKRFKVAEGQIIRIDPEAEAVTFESDHLLLSRVLGNMCKNALEACGTDDEVVVGCRTGKDWLEFWISNPGVIPRADQLQLFQRTFSTKGKGRGLGTYSMKLLGEQYLRGRVWFESSESLGTIFTIRLPLKLSPSASPDSR